MTLPPRFNSTLTAVVMGMLLWLNTDKVFAALLCVVILLTLIGQVLVEIAAALREATAYLRELRNRVNGEMS